MLPGGVLISSCNAGFRPVESRQDGGVTTKLGQYLAPSWVWRNGVVPEDGPGLPFQTSGIRERSELDCQREIGLKSSFLLGSPDHWGWVQMSRHLAPF
jgi:hypothetical protein